MNPEAINKKGLVRFSQKAFSKWMIELSNIHVNLLSNYKYSYLSTYHRVYTCSQWRNQVYQNLNQIIRILPKGKILDLGCGLGTQSYILSKLGYSVVPIETNRDLSITGFWKDREKAERQERDRDKSIFLVNKTLRDTIGTSLVWYDGQKIPLCDKSFDAVLAYAVFEHVPSNRLPELITALKKVLIKDGYLFIFELPQKYSYAENMARAIGLPSHDRLFTRKEIMDIVTTCGFRNIYFNRSGLICQRPLKLSNVLFPILRPLEMILSRTLLSHIYHHMEFAFQKVE